MFFPRMILNDKSGHRIPNTELLEIMDKEIASHREDPDCSWMDTHEKEFKAEQERFARVVHEKYGTDENSAKRWMKNMFFFRIKGEFLTFCRPNWNDPEWQSPIDDSDYDDEDENPGNEVTDRAVNKAKETWEYLVSGDLDQVLAQSEECLKILETVNKNALSTQDTGDILLPWLVMSQFSKDQNDTEGYKKYEHGITELVEMVSKKGPVGIGTLSDSAFAYADALMGLEMYDAAHMAAVIAVKGWGDALDSARDDQIDRVALTFNYAAAANLLAKVLIYQGDLETALKYARQSIDTWQNITYIGSPAVDRWMAGAFHTMGTIYGHMNKPIEGVQEFSKAISLLQKVLASPHELEKTQESVADAFGDLWLAWYSIIFEYNELNSNTDMVNSVTELADYLNGLFKQYPKPQSDPWNNSLNYLLGFIDHTGVELDIRVRQILSKARDLEGSTG